MMSDWQIFRGDGTGHERWAQRPEPPEWRRYRSVPEAEQQHVNDYWQKVQALHSEASPSFQRGRRFRVRSAQGDVVQAVNAAIYLRPPLMVTGKPGTGKTSLAYSIAADLRLGPVLVWPITTRTTLQDGLYRYDAIARLQDVQLSKTIKDKQANLDKIGRYFTLGPLGTAFLPAPYPRVLLIAEIDKSDLNLPNDLLHLFEEGTFPIPELQRIKQEKSKVAVTTADNIEGVEIHNGEVHCSEFPIVVMTSNGERDFPPAFLRRCLRVEMPDPDQEALQDVVKAHLEQSAVERYQAQIDEMIAAFLTRADSDAPPATDQLLNTVYLLTREYKPGEDELAKIQEILLRELRSE